MVGDQLTKEDEMLEELRRIRTLLEVKPAPTAVAPQGLWAEFMSFLSKYKVMGLAVAFIIAIYLGQLVLALVSDFIMPLIGLALPIGNLSGEYYQIGSQLFLYGHFLTALITFVIVAFVIFLIVKITKKWGIE